MDEDCALSKFFLFGGLGILIFKGFEGLRVSALVCSVRAIFFGIFFFEKATSRSG